MSCIDNSFDSLNAQLCLQHLTINNAALDDNFNNFTVSHYQTSY